MCIYYTVYKKYLSYSLVVDLVELVQFREIYTNFSDSRVEPILTGSSLYLSLQGVVGHAHIYPYQSVCVPHHISSHVHFCYWKNCHRGDIIYPNL